MGAPDLTDHDRFSENRRKLDSAQSAIDEALAIFECRTPGGGLGPGTHCAACCYGTGYVVTCEEEDVLVRALSDVSAALARYAEPQGGQS